MDFNAKKEYDELIERIYDLEDSVIRLANSSQIYYDESYHKRVIAEYSGIITDIKNSRVDEAEKNIMYSLIKEIFGEHLKK